MSRSVSVASGAFAVAYQNCSDFGYRIEDEEGNKIAEPEYDEYLGELDWEDFMENLRADAKALFPSLENCDKWLDREDHAILENRFAYFGISEYMGLVSIWFVLKENLNCYYSDQDLTAIAEHWAEQVKPKFEKNFGDLKKVGTFSNGEGLYERK